MHLKGEGTNPPSQQHTDARILSQNWFLFSLSHLHGTHMTEKKLPNTVSDHSPIESAIYGSINGRRDDARPQSPNEILITALF